MESSIAAISGDACFLETLQAGAFVARVHSAFNKVVNLWCADDATLYTLGCKHLDNAPNTIVGDINSFKALDLQPGATVTVTRGLLVSRSTFRMSIGGAHPWQPSLPAFPRQRMPIEWLKQFIEQEGVAGGMKVRQGTPDRVGGEIALTLATTATNLMSALSARELTSAAHHGAHLIGLGLGLTPSGDDFITGLSIICSMSGSRVHEYQPFLQRLVVDHAGRTNAISYAAMAQATRGRTRESIVDFVQSLAHGDLQLMRDRARKVASIGMTSGTDILSGLLAGLELNQKLGG